jgi:8-oxo-dGTP diphosphatase
MHMQISYVAGLLFSKDRKRVVLVRKKRPAWQAGMLNGVGGHIEPGELAAFSMEREFLKEAGICVNWRKFGRLYSSKWEVHWFKAFEDVTPVSKTDELVQWYPVQNALRCQNQLNIIPNVRWLILLALDNVEFEVRDDNLPGDG